MSNLQRIVFPNYNKSSSPVKSYKLTEEELATYQSTTKESKTKDFILIQTMDKQSYEKKLQPYKNGMFEISEEVIKLSSIKNLYKAKIKPTHVQFAFTSIVDELMKEETASKTIKATLDMNIIHKIDMLAKKLKLNRSQVIEKLLAESLTEIETRLAANQTA